MTKNFTNDGISGRTLVVEDSVIVSGVYVGVEDVEGMFEGTRTGVHLKRENVADLIEALKPYAEVEENWLAEWERELLEAPLDLRRFSVGDRVEVLSSVYFGAGRRAGATGTIVKRCDREREGWDYRVRLDESEGPAFGPSGWGFLESDLERYVEPIREVDGLHLGDEVTGYGDGRGVIVGFEDEVLKRGGYGDVLVDWSEGAGIGGRVLAASLSELTKVEPKPIQEYPAGTILKVVDDGREHGLRHFIEPGSTVEVDGWTDTSADSCSYDETYQVFALDGPDETLTQSLAPESLRLPTLAESLDRMAKAIAATVPARFVTGVEFQDPAVRTWETAFRDRPFVSYGFEEEDEVVKPAPKVEVEIHDRVEIVGSRYCGDALQPGATGSIVSISEVEGRDVVEVKVDTEDEFYRDTTWNFSRDEVQHLAGFFSPVSCPDCFDAPCDFPNIKRRG